MTGLLPESVYEARTSKVGRPIAVPTNVFAVVVGADAGGLGVIRSLGQSGVPTIIVDDDPLRPGMHSRFARPFVIESQIGSGLIAGLLQLRERLKHQPMLFLRSDAQVQTISQYRRNLGDAFQIRLPNHTRLCELLHKRYFQQLAENHGFPIARAVGIAGPEDLAKLEQIAYPAVIKVADAEVSVSTSRVRRVSSRQQAESVCRAMLVHASDLLVQEWVDGDDSEIYFCLQYRGSNGVTVSSFTGRKLRCWPLQIGKTATCTAALEAEVELGEMTAEFFKKTECVGMCSMEYKRERNTGKMFMIEPTVGRTDWQEEVASLNGVNIPLSAYRYELGLPLPSETRPDNPRIWTYPLWHWRSVVVSGALRDTRPPRATKKSACWRANDPMPFAFFILEWVRKAASYFSLLRNYLPVCSKAQLRKMSR